MNRIKPLKLVGKERRKGIFLKGIKDKYQTTEMKENQVTSMTEDLMMGLKEGQTKENKTKDRILNLQGSNVLVARDMVT